MVVVGTHMYCSGEEERQYNMSTHVFLGTSISFAAVLGRLDYWLGERRWNAEKERFFTMHDAYVDLC